MTKSTKAWGFQEWRGQRRCLRVVLRVCKVRGGRVHMWAGAQVIWDLSLKNISSKLNQTWVQEPGTPPPRACLHHGRSWAWRTLALEEPCKGTDCPCWGEYSASGATSPLWRFISVSLSCGEATPCAGRGYELLLQVNLTSPSYRETNCLGCTPACLLGQPPSLSWRNRLGWLEEGRHSHLTSAQRRCLSGSSPTHCPGGPGEAHVSWDTPACPPPTKTVRLGSHPAAPVLTRWEERRGLSPRLWAKFSFCPSDLSDCSWV